MSETIATADEARIWARAVVRRLRSSLDMVDAGLEGTHDKDAYAFHLMSEMTELVLALSKVDALAEVESLKKELKAREMNDLARRQFSRHASKISLYGVAQTTDGTETGPIEGWVRASDGRESFQTVGEALRVLEFVGWNGVVCSYPDGKHRMTRADQPV